jgi:hypothetical protein
MGGKEVSVCVCLLVVCCTCIREFSGQQVVRLEESSSFPMFGAAFISSTRAFPRAQSRNLNFNRIVHRSIFFGSSRFTLLYKGTFPPYVFISKIDLCQSWFGQVVSCISYLRLFASY